MALLEQALQDRTESFLEQGDLYSEEQKYMETTQQYLAGLELIVSLKEEHDIALDL